MCGNNSQQLSASKWQFQHMPCLQQRLLSAEWPVHSDQRSWMFFLPSEYKQLWSLCQRLVPSRDCLRSRNPSLLSDDCQQCLHSMHSRLLQERPKLFASEHCQLCFLLFRNEHLHCLLLWHLKRNCQLVQPTSSVFRRNYDLKLHFPKGNQVPSMRANVEHNVGRNSVHCNESRPDSLSGREDYAHISRQHDD